MTDSVSPEVTEPSPSAFRVEVVPYSATWPMEAEQEMRAISHTLRETLERAHHIGSTAVPGLMAKPIIDLLLEVRSLEALDSTNSQMERLGYEAMGEFGIPGRRYFRKGSDPRTHQVHAFAVGDSAITRHLAFRYYLRSHSEVAVLYGQLKQRLARQFPSDLDGYCDGKDAFVKCHEALALDWQAR